MRSIPLFAGTWVWSGGCLDFLGSQPFVLLFLTLALGTRLGRQPLGFIKLGSTAGTLLVGILISLAAHLGYGIKYDVPALLTTVFLNLFMFAVGLKVGPQFFAGLRLDGLKFVTISLLVVVLNFAAVFILSKTLGLAPGFATGIIAGSMTDTAVIGAAAGAVQSGSYQPPAGITADGVMGNVAAGYAIIYLFSLVGIILLIRYLPRLFSVDVVAAAREAEESYGGGENRLPFSGTEAAYKLPALKVDVRAYRVENPSCFGLPLFEFSEKYEVPVLQLLRGDQVIDFDSNPIMQEGDIVTVVAEAERLIRHGTQVVGPEVADERARRLDLEVADLVVTRKEFSGLPMKEAAERMRRAMFPKASEVARIFHPLGVIRAGESIPVWSTTKLERGDIARVLGPRNRIDQAGKIVGAVVRYSTASDVLSMAIGLGLGYIFGYLSIQIGAVPVSLGTPAGVMLAGIAMSTLRSRYPLFGRPGLRGGPQPAPGPGAGSLHRRNRPEYRPERGRRLYRGRGPGHPDHRHPGGPDTAVDCLADRLEGAEAQHGGASGGHQRGPFFHAGHAGRPGGLRGGHPGRGLPGPLRRSRRAGAGGFWHF